MFLDSVVSVLAAVTLAAYGWSVRGHFASPKTPVGAWLISAAVVVSAILLAALTWLLVQPLAAQLTGIALEVASAWLFLAAVRVSRRAQLRFVFDPVRPHSLLKEGPYAHVRHPFYASYILFWTGWSIAAWSVIAIPVPVTFIVLYVVAARMEERNFASSPMAAEHAAYTRRVGFLIPHRSRNRVV